MFIETIELYNFKRFTDLTSDLSGLKPPPKLVLLSGYNLLGHYTLSSRKLASTED